MLYKLYGKGHIESSEDKEALIKLLLSLYWEDPTETDYRIKLDNDELVCMIQKDLKHKVLICFWLDALKWEIYDVESER